MRDNRVRTIFGLVLILAGALFLLQNMGILLGAVGLLWGLLFAGAGGVFLYVYMNNQDQWWALIPAFSLFGLGALIATTTLFPAWGDTLGAPIFFVGISGGFWIIALTKKDQWWALIPAGVMLTLAVFIALESAFPRIEWVGVFFLGLGMTFGLVALVPRTEQRMTWAYIPGGIFLLMGVLFLAASTTMLKFVGPALLVLAGLYLVLRGVIRRSDELETDV
jgi:hypothetical protein